MPEESILQQDDWTPGEDTPANTRFGVERDGQTLPRNMSLAQVATELVNNNLIVPEGATFLTLADLVAADVPAAVGVCTVLGHTTNNDGRVQRYKRDVAPAGLGKVQSNDGAWWIAFGDLDPKHHAVNAPGDTAEIAAFFALPHNDKPVNPRDFPWELEMNYPTSGDEGAALQQFFDDIKEIPFRFCEINGYVGTSIELTLTGSGFDLEGGMKRFQGHLEIQCTAALTGPSFTIQDHYYADLQNLHVSTFGTGGATYATRTCREGILVNGTNARGRFGWLHAQNFLARGITIESVTATPPDASNSNSCQFAVINTQNCGAGKSTPVTDTFTWSSDEGSDASPLQRTILTLGSAPDADLIAVIINGEPYLVDHADPLTTGNDIAVEPWVPTADRSAGTLTLVIGYGLRVHGADTNNIVITTHDSGNCGIGHWATGLKFAKVLNEHSESDQISLALGATSAGGGTSADINLYSEGALWQLWIITNVNNSNSRIRFVTDDVFDEDITKVRKLGPKFGGADYAAYQRLDGYQLEYSTGEVLTPTGNNSEMLNESAPNMQTGEGRSVRTLNQDSATITLKSRPGVGKLLGYYDITIVCRGTGANGQPTGTYTLTPDDSGDTISYYNDETAAGIGKAITFTQPTTLRCTYIPADATWKVHRDDGFVQWGVESNAITSTQTLTPGNYDLGTRSTPLNTAIVITPASSAAIGQEWNFFLPANFGASGQFTFVTGGSFDVEGNNVGGNIVATDADSAAGETLKIKKKSATLYEVTITGNIFDRATQTTYGGNDHWLLVQDDTDKVQYRMDFGNIISDELWTAFGDATDPLGFVTLQQAEALVSNPNLALPNCKVAAQSNVDISTLNNGDTVDGETVSTGDYVLLPNQTTDSENGPYEIAASEGSTSRIPEADTDSEVVNGLITTIDSGTDAGKTYRLNTPNPITVEGGSPDDQLWQIVTGGNTAAINVTTTSHDDITATNQDTYNEQLADKRVKKTTTITATSPIRIDGGGSADLSANRTLSIAAASLTTPLYVDGSVTAIKIEDVSANSVICRPEATTGSRSSIALVAERLVGRAAAGNVKAMDRNDINPMLTKEFTMVSGTLDQENGEHHLIADAASPDPFVIPAPTNYVPGKTYHISIEADATQTHDLSWNAAWKISSGDSLPSVRPATGVIVMSYYVTDLEVGGSGIVRATRVDYAT